jgi:hypothetical protein
MERLGNAPKKSQSFVWLPEMDRLLLVGMKHGREGIRLASGRLRQLAPKLPPDAIWQRMRHLRESASKGYRDPTKWSPEILDVLKEGYQCGGFEKKEALEVCRKHYPGVPLCVISGFARRQGWTQSQGKAEARTVKRAWTRPEEEMLWRLAGYESPKLIARKLRRTENAVRLRLKAHGLSAKVKDGFSLRAFRELFHIGHQRAYSLIAGGMLRVRDPRITHISLLEFCRKHEGSWEHVPATHANAESRHDSTGYSWERVASLLHAPLDQVKAWVASRQLRVADTFISDRALEEFCRSCGKEGGPRVNLQLIEPKTLDWLANEYGIKIPPAGASPSVAPSEKQALTVRVCGKCRKQVRGNVYFAHIRRCKGAPVGSQLPFVGVTSIQSGPRSTN